jgi:hypothetical protein
LIRWQDLQPLVKDLVWFCWPEATLERIKSGLRSSLPRVVPSIVVHTPIKLKPEKGSKQRPWASSRLEQDRRTFSQSRLFVFVLAHNLFGPGFDARVLDTFLLWPMPMKAEENQFVLSATYKAARVLFPELS